MLTMLVGFAFATNSCALTSQGLQRYLGSRYDAGQEGTCT